MEFRIETYGCSMNKADSEAMAGLLLAAGFSEGDGGVLVVNTCTVKTPTEKKILRRLKSLAGKKVVVSGCLPAASPDVADRFPDFSFIGTNVEDVVEAVKAASAGGRLVRIGSGSCRLSLPRRRESPVIEIVPIAQGCVGDCSYCITKRARGCLVSYPREQIVERIKEAVSGGVKEVWLTAQDTGAYGMDIGESLPALLEDVCSLSGDFRVRVGMMNPSHVGGFVDRLVDAFRDDKIYKFLHLPLQSGDDRILSEMNRCYSVSDFLGIVRRFRMRFPLLTLSTDVIVGYPSETEEEFEHTLSAVEESRPSVLNVSRYWMRPGTKAAGEEQLHGRVSKQRSRRVVSLFRRIGAEENRRWVGWVGGVLVSEKAVGGFCGRNFAYRPILLRSKENLLGRAVKAEITSATSYYLRGALLP